jgi:hypothetical protein
MEASLALATNALGLADTIYGCRDMYAMSSNLISAHS